MLASSENWGSSCESSYSSITFIYYCQELGVIVSLERKMFCLSQKKLPVSNEGFFMLFFF